MADVTDHYENLLAGVYTWLYGGAEPRIAANRSFFMEHGIAPHLSGNAVDLGCGPGFQSIPLAEIGFHVTAVDFSETLLMELEGRRGALPIVTVRADLLDFTRHTPDTLELAVCMGDTLTHLPDFEAVERLLADVFKKLEAGGKLVLTFRNLMPEMPRTSRFIPVRSDDNKVFSCFLEYEGEYAIVHDILYTRGVGGWELKKSFYRKLRIAPERVMNLLERIGYSKASLREEGDFVTIIAGK
ncbi:MAG: class I SAM-dependent methyltransferase [Nitrospinae bacterium]|nr:class I SAM-dependent methyltransferase [Nitrospinota bacterium]